MHSGLRISSVSLRCARFAAAGVVALTIAWRTAPAFATPALDALAPRVFAIDYAPKGPLAIGAEEDSGRSYANMKVYGQRSRTGAIHLHGGVFAPINATATSATIGARLGANLGDPLLLGLQSGWTYHSKSLLESANYGLPGLEPKTVLATAEAHLIPAMAFLQVTLTEKFPLVPYVGVGAGYEWLILKAKDYRTDADSSVTYGNWAWEWYAGMGIKISRGLRVDAEAFYNGGALERDVSDVNGVRRREAVDIDGAGARIGLHIVY